MESLSDTCSALSSSYDAFKIDRGLLVQTEGVCSSAFSSSGDLIGFGFHVFRGWDSCKMDYRRDEYGNPVKDTTYEQVGGHTGTGALGSAVTDRPAGVGYGTTGTGAGQPQMVHGTEKEGHGVLGGMLHRSGSSSSSSSSEDDGHGGRRKKKGIKEKIKEKLPGAHKDQSSTEYRTEYDAAGRPITHKEEKKGVMEKIKEKLPGHHE